MSSPSDKQRDSACLNWLNKHQFVDSGYLFGDLREVIIKHNDECYRLQITKSNKLILTK